jgi:hypothetical protein
MAEHTHDPTPEPPQLTGEKLAKFQEQAILAPHRQAIASLARSEDAQKAVAELMELCVLDAARQIKDKKVAARDVIHIRKELAQTEAICEAILRGGGPGGVVSSVEDLVKILEMGGDDSVLPAAPEPVGDSDDE